MASSAGERDLLRPTALVVALAALHHVQRRARLRKLAALAVVFDGHDDDNDVDDDDELDGAGEDAGAPAPKRTRRVYPRSDYSQSEWAVLLRCEDIGDPASRAARSFRRRFRIPYPFFRQLVELVKRKKLFPAAEKDAVGRQCVPIELKVLASIQVLGRGHCFDDVSRQSLMSEATAAATLHKFCKYFASELFDKHVHLPTGAHQQDEAMAQYDRLGFTGAIGSTDSAHIRWSMCPYSLSSAYTGKEEFPTIAYQLTVDRSGRCLGVTGGFTGATDVKEIMRHDAAVKMVRENPAYRDRVFKFRKADGSWGERKGCYLLSGHSNHEWAALMAPTKQPATIADANFSDAMEGVRKDVGCFFSALKGRFRILKLNMGYHKKEDIDSVFFTCCILHNMLLTFEASDSPEDKIDWAGNAGLHDPWSNDRSVDFSSVGAFLSEQSGEKVEVEEGNAEFRRELVASFKYRKRIKDIVRLSR